MVVCDPQRAGGRPRPGLGSEAELVEALRRRDEDAFATVLARYHGSLVRAAMAYVGTAAAAEDAAQETWVGVVRSIDRFEGRSSLRTWIFRILVNRAKSRAMLEARTLPFSSLDEDHLDERAVGSGWSLSAPLAESPEERVVWEEMRNLVERQIEELPARQRQVIVLHDLVGLGSDEVRALVGVSEANQRVLLHRARARVRDGLADYLAPVDGPAGDG